MTNDLIYNEMIQVGADGVDFVPIWIGFPKHSMLGIGEQLKSLTVVNAYNAHEVAEILADLFGDTCACNINRIDEWLPEKCELQTACPNPVGVACWEQYLKYRGGKDEE